MPCGRVSLLWWVASATAGCISNGSVTLVGADCLSNGGFPSPIELHHPVFSCACSETLHPEHLESPFCLSHCAGLNAVSLKSPCLAHCPSPVQSDGYTNLPSQVSDCRLNRAPRPVRFVWSCSATTARAAAALAAGCTSQNLCLVSRVSFIPRNFPVLWETKIRLEMLTHPLHALTMSFNPGLFSQHHLESSDRDSFLYKIISL